MNRPSRCAPLVALLVALVSGCETAPDTGAQPAEPTAPVEAQPTPTVEPAPQPVPQPAPAPAPVEVKEPEAPPPKVVCEPPPAPKPEPAPPQRPASVLPILGVYENVLIEPPGLPMKARLDTGSPLSYIDARDVREFERDGKPWVKFMLSDRASGKPVEVSRPMVRTTAARGGAKRFVVTLRTRLGGIDQFTEYQLVDRSTQAYAVVLGLNFLRDQALVDAARRFTVQPAKP